MTSQGAKREENYGKLLKELYACSELMLLGRYHSGHIKGYIKRNEPWELPYLQLWLENILADQSSALATAFAPYQRAHSLLRSFLREADESYLSAVLELRSLMGTAFSYKRYPEDEFFYQAMSSAFLRNSTEGYSELYRACGRFVRHHEEQLRLHRLWEDTLNELEKLEVKTLLKGYFL